MAELNTTETAEVMELTEPTPIEPVHAELPKTESSELLKIKAALDKAAKEAADYKKQLRARQSAEETKAQEEAESKAAMENELSELRKRFAVADHAKRIIPFVEDEATSGTIADSLYGAADADAVIDAFAKAWAVKEKKLRLEFGKIPAPAAGDSSASLTREQFAAMPYSERMELASKNPELYKKLTN